MKGSYDYYKMFGFNRKFKISDRSPPADVIDAFSFCTNRSKEMSPDQFRRFLIEFQGEHGVTVDDAKLIMEQVLHQFRPKFSLCCFTLDDFFKYLFMDDLNGPVTTQVCD